jgi:cupin fold WbuC family metalloprotein
MAVLSGKKATETQWTTRRMLDEISLQAKQSPRLRKNYNFHHSDEDICHRLLNAMEPGSYIQPHRHLDRNKDETLVVIRGKMGLILFDDHGNIEEKVLLELADHAMIVNIPHGKFHTWISFEERSVFFESKAGPFLPLTEEEKAFWAPKEGDASSAAYLASLKKCFESDKRQHASST